mgnify:CR=1 FL=1
MQKNKISKKIIGLIVILSLIGLFAVVAIVLPIAYSENDWSIGFSIASSIISIILSVIAIIYSVISGVKLDSQIIKLTELVKSLQNESSKIDTKMAELAVLEDNLSPELKTKIKEFRNDIQISISSLYKD